MTHLEEKDGKEREGGEQMRKGRGDKDYYYEIFTK